ncbi:hypothetical protein JL720_3313 [Aureococcus anophagefferens]|nr:hypothetical protein JL720_3313 [Aureococcus anophagefferens]
MGRFDVDVARSSTFGSARAWHGLLDKRGDPGIGKVELVLVAAHDPALAVPTPAAMLEAEAKPGDAPNCLSVRVVRAKGLAIMDKHLLSKGGSSDPVVTLEIGGMKQTSTCKPKCLAPKWLEDFAFSAEDGEDELVVAVWDQDLASGNDFMGDVRVDLESLADRKVHRAWHALRSKAGDTAQGSVAVWKSTTGLGGPHQTSELSISIKSKSIRLIFDGSIALVEFSKRSERVWSTSFEYAHIEVGLKI